jgi:hypothetical protein
MNGKTVHYRQYIACVDTWTPDCETAFQALLYYSHEHFFAPHQAGYHDLIRHSLRSNEKTVTVFRRQLYLEATLGMNITQINREFYLANNALSWM